MPTRLHRRNPTAVRHRCAQRCDSENEHSVVIAMVLIVMRQRWNSSGSDSAEIMMCTLVTALSVATTFTMMYTSLSH